MSARAEIYDLGYKRYAGLRLPQSSRWRVIMRHQITSAFRGFWRYKLALCLALLATTVSAMVMAIYQDKAVGIFGEQGQRLADSVVPLSTATFCKIGLLVSLTVSASSIADDVNSGAFTFYFARSTRPLDYVFGKMAGLYVLLLPIMLAGPLILAGVQLALTPENRNVVDELVVLPKTVFVGMLGTLIYSIVPLGFSAMARGRMLALGGWVIYYLVVAQIASLFALFVWGPIGAFDIAGSLLQTSLHVFGLSLDVKLNVPLWASLGGILVPAVASVAVALHRVKHAADTGVGGAS